MTDGAIDIGFPGMQTTTATIVRVDWEDRLRMAALAHGFRAIIQLKTGMVAGPGMADDTGFRTTLMDGLGIHMAQTAGYPVKGHIGYIREGIHMIGCPAFLDVAHGALHIGFSRVIPGSAPVVRIDGEYGLGMTALTLRFRAVIEIDTGMVSCACMTGRTGLVARDVICLGVRMAKAACIPLQRHIGDIGKGIHMVEWIALTDMTDGAINISCAFMDTTPAPIIRIDGEYGFDVAALTHGFRAIIQFQAGMVAGAGMADDTGFETGLMEDLGTPMA